MHALFLALLLTTGVVEKRADRVVIDWTAGTLAAAGAGAADLRAPGPDVARVAAERQARKDAAKRLRAAAAGLKLADGRTAPDGALDDLVARAKDVEVRYGSDGSVVIVKELPLEALRGAAGAGKAAAPGPDAPSAVVVDARGLEAAPVLGVRLAAGTVRYTGPTIWAAGEEILKDPRVGARPWRVKAVSWQAGALTIDAEPGALAAARGALVVVLIKERP